MSERRTLTRRAWLKASLGTGVMVALPGCGTTPATPPPPPPPSPPSPPAIWRDPFGARFVVVIDPGHGGNDAGTRGVNGLLEKDLTLDVAQRLRARLTAMDGIDVVLTRERDHWLSRGDRVAAVRDAGADLVLSLHFNDLPERDVALVETYYAHASNIVDSRTRRRDDAAQTGVSEPIDPTEPDDVSFTRGSRRFAALVQRHVFDAVRSGNPQAVDAGVKRDTLFVLTRSATSGALVELTCLSNAEEAGRLAGEAYLDGLAAGLSLAVAEYRGLSNVIGPVSRMP